ncbi:MAG TPA: tetratricopeptide repeat protein [Thermoguttaceae bacterium]|nr:tetratricopeptide repeat protein [Thermoguttaceae bacterium]
MGLLDFFRRGSLGPLDEPSDALRERFFQAVQSGSQARLVRLCRRYRSRANELFLAWRTVPEEVCADREKADRYMAAMIAVAQCYAEQLGEPGPMQILVVPDDANPLVQWERKLNEAGQLVSELRYPEAIEVLTESLKTIESCQGTGAERYTAMFHGQIGACLFYSGRVPESQERLETALDVCRRIGDTEGVLAYLGNLVEVHRYLGQTDRAADYALQLAEFHDQAGDAEQAAHYRKWASQIRAGEPLNRVVVQTETDTQELDEFTCQADGHYKFLFVRNRPTLALATSLTAKACELASAGSHADAMELFAEAMEVDPYDPDPPYQVGMCLLEMGCYEEARKHFLETERLAPGWFHCRTDAWLAGQLAEGAIAHEAFLLHRQLEDGGLEPGEIVSLCESVLPALEDFGPVWLAYGNALSLVDRKEEAERALRSGLACTDEPDLRSRLLSSLAVLLPEGPERRELFRQAMSINGNFIAAAMARVVAISQDAS